MVDNRLTGLGFEVWRDERRIERDWSRDIASGLAGADAVVVLWTAASAASRWVQNEWLTTRALEKRIEILRVPGAPLLPLPLENAQAVTLGGRTARDVERACAALDRRFRRDPWSGASYEFDILPGRSFLPFPPNLQFTGRKADLLDLYLTLVGDLNKIGRSAVGLLGMGGVGKTQIAIEFARRFAFAFDAVYWIQGGDSGGWRRQFVSLARDRLGLRVDVGDGQDPEEQALLALVAYFAEHPNILVVMDNVIDPQRLNWEGDLYSTTPISLGCNLLFTTRRAFELPGVSSLTVGVLAPTASIRLLESYRQPRSDEEAALTGAICTALGYLPLAIVLAGAYLREYAYEVGFDTYLAELRRNRLGTVDSGRLTPQHLATRHEAAVRTTLRSQWEMLKDRAARELFLLACEFGEAELIPIGRLGLFSGIPPGRTPIERPLARAIHLLRALSLVEVVHEDGGAVRLHPLIREFAAQLVGTRGQRSFRRAAAAHAKDLAFEYERLHAELRSRGVEQVIGDLEVTAEWLGRRDRDYAHLRLLARALRLSAATLSEDPDELPGQLRGRLFQAAHLRIGRLLDGADTAEGYQWLRPRWAALTAPDSTLLRTMRHESITSLAVSTDGRIAVTGAADGSLRVWDLETGRMLLGLAGEGEAVEAVALSHDGLTAVVVFHGGRFAAFRLPEGEQIAEAFGQSSGIDTQLRVGADGQTAVLTSYKGAVNVWHLQSRSRVRRIRTPTGTSVATPDGRAVLIGHERGSLHVVRPLSRDPVRTLPGHRGDLRALAIAADASLAAAGWKDGTVQIWDLDAERKLAEVVCEGWADGAAFTPDAAVLVIATWAGTLDIWDVASGARERVVDALAGLEKSLVFSEDGRLALLGSDSGMLQAWALPGWRELWTVLAHGRDAKNVALLQDSRRAVSASFEGNLKLWDLARKPGRPSPQRHKEIVYDVAIDAAGDTGVSASQDGDVAFWRLESGRGLRGRDGHWDGVLRIAVSADGARAVSASRDRTLIVWDAVRGRVIHRLVGHADQVGALAVTPDARVGLSGSWDGTLRVWDLRRGVLLHELESAASSMSRVAVTPDGRYGVCDLLDRTVIVWDLVSGRPVQRLQGDPDGVWRVAISEDGRVVATGGHHGEVWVWDVSSGRCVHRLDAGGNQVDQLSMTPDGRIAVADCDSETGQLSVWDLQRGRLLHTLEGHKEPVIDVAATPSGSLAVSASLDSSLRVWDLRTGAQVARFGGDFVFRSVAVTPDGKRIFAGDDSGAVHAFDLRG